MVDLLKREPGYQDRILNWMFGEPDPGTGRRPYTPMAHARMAGDVGQAMVQEAKERPLETASASGIPVVSDLADARLAGQSIGKAWREPSKLNLLEAGANVGLAALPFAGIAAVKQPGKSLIKDWRWRPEKEVAAELGTREVPGHVLEFGRYMGEMADKAKAGEMSARDLVKAFTITRSSIQRSALSSEKVRERWPDFPGTGKVTPEGAFSEWLLTPLGKRYLDQAERGELDTEAVQDAVTKLGGYGKGNDLQAALTDATRLPGHEGKVGAMVAQAFDKPGEGIAEWRAWTRDLPGIGPAKSGFVAAMLGRGDIPTLDARQIQFQTGRPTAEAQPYLRRGGGQGGYQAVDRLAERQKRLDLLMPGGLEPFRQHSTHHTIWDKMGGTQTTHEDVVRAMRLAGIPIGLLAAGELTRDREPGT